MLSVLTVGHSTHSWERFAKLLSAAGVTAVADVRSSPYSRHTPHFNRETLIASLRTRQIAYVFLGKELGGRPDRPDLFTAGVADYEKMAATETFRAGLDRIIEGARRYHIALMCSEHDPLDCHRCLLVARRLRDRSIDVAHVLSNGSVESHSSIEDRLLNLQGLAKEDFFATREQRLNVAYRERNLRVAYAENEPDVNSPTSAM